MFVVKVETEDAFQFLTFRRRHEALAHVRRRDDGIETPPALVFDVSDTDDAEIAVMAVRDGLGVPVAEREPDAAVMLASMGLGTGLRI